MHDLQNRMEHTLGMLDLDNLTVAGDVRFGKDVTLRGNVIS